MLNPRFVALSLLILAAAATRVLPHPPNMTAMAAMALFGGALFADKRLAFLAPLAALLISDAVLGFHAHMPVTYVSFAFIVCIGLWLQTRRQPLFIAGAALTSSVVFFVASNLGEWLLGLLYPRTWEGLVACFTLAIPFFGSTLIGDLIYTAVLFGGFALLEKYWSAVREPTIATA